MKRTPFKKKPYQWKRKPKKETKGLFADYKPEKKGLFKDFKKKSKTREWADAKRDILDPWFKENGLYYVCELKLSRCLGSALDLTYAHSKKRGDIALEEPERTRELCEVVRACVNCHHDIEYIPKHLGGRKKMYEIVTKHIAIRAEIYGKLPIPAKALDNEE